MSKMVWEKTKTQFLLQTNSQDGIIAGSTPAASNLRSKPKSVMNVRRTCDGSDGAKIFSESRSNPKNVTNITNVTPTTNPISTKEGAETQINRLSIDGPIALDIETYGNHPLDGLDPWRGDIRLLSIMVGSFPPVIFDVRAIGYDFPGWTKLLSGREWVGHNLRFDAGFIAAKLGLYPERVFCTYSASKLLNNGDQTLNNDLGAVLRDRCDIHLAKEFGDSDWASMYLSADQLRYAADDVRHLFILKGRLIEELDAAGLLQVAGLEMRLLPVVVRMEAAGFPVDREGMVDFAARTDEQSAAARRELRELFGPEINFNSPEQLQEAFTKAGVQLPDTAEATLKKTGHPAVALILRYRTAEMLRRLTPLADIHEDSRIYAEFRPLGTDTGRFSSRNPNLQNVPRGPLRRYFGPTDPEKRLVIADYSQIELRIAAWLARDERMLEAFRRGADLHRRTAAVVLGKLEEQITKDDRQLAKAVNFGLLYGQGATGLVQYAETTYGVQLEFARAAQIRARFFEHYSELAAWHRTAWDRAKETTEGRTAIGRRLLIPESKSDWHRFQAQINLPVQGSAADGLKYAMILLSSRLPAGARIVGTVHDELIIECTLSQAEQTKSVTEESMLEGMKAVFPQMPCEVEAKIARNWGEK